MSDYYNLIHRHNINNYYLCKVSSFGEKNLTKDEIESFHLSTLKMTFEEAVKEYEKCSNTKLGRLIANRELPMVAVLLMDNLPPFLFSATINASQSGERRNMSENNKIQSVEDKLKRVIMYDLKHGK